MIIREERIGGQRLILGDCREVMPMLGRFDACRRVDEATRQADLFVATPAPQPVQEVLL